jgi:hypothetical protein
VVTTCGEVAVAKKNQGRPADRPPDGSARKTGSVQVKADLAKKLGVIAQHTGRPAWSMLDPLIRPWVETEFARAIREMSKELED